MIGSSDKIRGNRITDLDENTKSFYLNTSNPVFIISRKGKISEVNNAFCQKIGLSKHEILGTHIGDAVFLTKDARKKAMQRHVSRLIGKETPFYTIDAIDRTGDIVTLEIDTKPIVKHGKVAGEINIIQNYKQLT